MAICVIVALFKRVNLTFMWLSIQFVQLCSFICLFQVGLNPCLIAGVSWLSLLRVDIFDLRSLYNQSDLKPPLADSFRYHGLGSLDYLYNAPMYILGFCLLATVMIFIVLAALVMP